MLAALAGGQASAYLDEAGMPDVITANRLTDGVVVFQTLANSWAEDFNRAAVLSDPQAAAEAIKNPSPYHCSPEKRVQAVTEPLMIAKRRQQTIAS